MGYFLFNCLIIVLIILICIANKILYKYNKRIIPKILKYVIIILLTITFIGITEYSIHSQDQYEILENKFAIPYLFASFLPLENNFENYNYKIKLPYGYKTINNYSAVSIIGSPQKIYNELNDKYIFFDQFGSSTIYLDSDQIISLIHIRRGCVNYLIMNIIIIED